MFTDFINILPPASQSRALLHFPGLRPTSLKCKLANRSQTKIQQAKKGYNLTSVHLKINSQRLEDTQVGYTSQKYTLEIQKYHGRTDQRTDMGRC